MKKKISVILIGLLLTFTSMIKLNAASASISVSVNRSSLVVGNTVNATVTVYSSGGIGSWEYTINYDTSKLKLVSGQVSVADVAQSSGKTSVSYNYTFKAIASGSASIGVKSYSVINWDVQELSTTANSKTVRIITQQELEASYSKNNNLSGITVEGYELDGTFDKEKLEYTVSVPSDTEKIKLNASVEDSTASLTGIGEFDVSEGDNKFDIIVTAQNGNQKTYSVTVKVEDKNPITATIDNKKYTLVKRASTLTCPNTYEETKVIIDGIEVPAFKSSITDFVLVGMKDEQGNIGLFLYDESNNKFSKYTEIKTTGLVIYPKEPKTIPTGYKKVTISINDQEVTAYTYNDNKEFYLIYGINIENNKEDFYEYDKTNNTMSRYNGKIIEELTTRNENYMMIILILGVETILLLMILLITFIRNKKRRKRLMQKRLEKHTEEVSEETNKENKEQEVEEEEQNNKKQKKEKKHNEKN